MEYTNVIYTPSSLMTDGVWIMLCMTTEYVAMLSIFLRSVNVHSK